MKRFAATEKMEGFSVKRACNNPALMRKLDRQKRRPREGPCKWVIVPFSDVEVLWGRWDKLVETLLASVGLPMSAVGGGHAEQT